MVKEALKYFFDLALEFNLKYNRNNLEYDMFLTCIDETLVSSEMYIHKKNDYVYWLPIEKKEIYDFSPIEKEFNIIIHHDIKEYYNSYYFLELLTGTEQYGDSILYEKLADSLAEFLKW